MPLPGAPLWRGIRSFSGTVARAARRFPPASLIRRAAEPLVFTGRVMGTSYALTVPRRPLVCDPAGLHAAAAGELDRVERLMSTYRGDSDVSRINSAAHTDWLSVSTETAFVVQLALEVGRLSEGTYDITVGPLVNLWGFGAGGRAGSPPSDEEIASVLPHIGLDLVQVRAEPPAVRKCDPQVRIDLAGVAKGYAVDLAAGALERLGMTDYCIEVGGEVRVRGRNAERRPWQIAVETPDPGGQGVHRVLSMERGSVATSGDYRLFFEHGGRHYCHLVNPRTGQPVRTAVTSATVVHECCGQADAWATALTLSEPEAVLERACRHGLAALLLVKTPQGVLEKLTPAFERLLDRGRIGRRWRL